MKFYKNDKDFLVTTAKSLLNENSFRLFSTNINHKIEVLGKSINVHFEKPENLKLNLQNNEILLNVYEILENSRVYSEHDIDPNNLEVKINTTQDDSLFIQGYEVFNEKEYNFFQNGKNIDLTLESESHGNVEFKLLYIKDENEFFAIDLEDKDDIEDMFSQIQSYLKG